MMLLTHTRLLLMCALVFPSIMGGPNSGNAYGPGRPPCQFTTQCVFGSSL